MQTTSQKITAREYEKLPEGPPSQLIGGEIIMSPSPSAMHQYIVLELASKLKEFVESNKSGFVYTAPLDVYLGVEEVFQPDVIYISASNKNIIKDKIKGIPDLIIEVLSPSNAYYDLVHKKNIYEETGVKEFWTVDSEGKGIEVYENVDGKFILFSKSRSKGTVESKLLPGFRVTSEELFVEK